MQWNINTKCGSIESFLLIRAIQVWSEPEVVEAAAYEFQDTADFLKAGICYPFELSYFFLHPSQTEQHDTAVSILYERMEHQILMVADTTPSTTSL